MAVGSKDIGQTPTADLSQDGPTRPTAIYRPTVWPDNASRPAQNAAANEMVKQHDHARRNAGAMGQEQQARNERIQEAPDAELKFVKDRGRQNYAELRQATADAIERNATERREPGERELSFVKDGSRSSEQRPEQDFKPAGKELTFVKDQERDRGQIR